jgi:hypothetical protein
VKEIPSCQVTRRGLARETSKPRGLGVSESCKIEELASKGAILEDLASEPQELIRQHSGCVDELLGPLGSLWNTNTSLVSLRS